MGCDAENLGPRLLASSALSALRSSQHHWISTGHRSSLPTLVVNCFGQLEAGLASINVLEHTNL